MRKRKRVVTYLLPSEKMLLENYAFYLNTDISEIIREAILNFMPVLEERLSIMEKRKIPREEKPGI